MAIDIKAGIELVYLFRNKTIFPLLNSLNKNFAGNGLVRNPLIFGLYYCDIGIKKKFCCKTGFVWGVVRMWQ
jgi:hypothetical protein